MGIIVVGCKQGQLNRNALPYLAIFAALSVLMTFVLASAVDLDGTTKVEADSKKLNALAEKTNLDYTLSVTKGKESLKSSTTNGKYKEVYFENIADEYPTIIIKNDSTGQDIASINLTKNTDICAVNCESEGYIQLFRNDVLINDVYFINLSNNPRGIVSEKYFIEKTRQLNLTEEKMNKTGFLVTNSTVTDFNQTNITFYFDYMNGNFTRIEKYWSPYVQGTILPAGTYHWRQEIKKNVHDSLDWQPAIVSTHIPELAPYDSAFTAYRELTFNNSYTVTNGTFPINITFNGTKHAYDFSNIRFVNLSNATEYDYHLEAKTDGVSALFFFRIPETILVGQNYTLLEYTNATGVNYTGNGDKAFLFYDNFTTLDTGKWTNNANYVLNATNNALQSPSPDGQFYISKTNFNDVIMATRHLTYSTLTNNYYGMVGRMQSAGGGNGYLWDSESGGSYIYRLSDFGQSASTANVISPDVWTYNMFTFLGDSIKGNINGANSYNVSAFGTQVSLTSSTYTSGGFGFRKGAAASFFLVDFVYIRNYTEGTGMNSFSFGDWKTVAVANLANPNVTITFPQNTTYSRTNTLFPDTVQLNFTVQNSTAIDRCIFSKDNFVTNSSLLACGNATLITSNQGSNTWKLFVNETNGASNMTAAVTFFVDTLNPDVSVATPANNTNTSNNQIQVNFTRNDTNFAFAWWSSNSGTTNTTLAAGANITGQTWPHGQTNITIWSNDTLGNVNSTGVSFYVYSKNIDSCLKLQDMNRNMSDSYNITAAINCNVAPFNVEPGFQPVGTSTNSFTGKLTGNFNTITGLFINRTGSTDVGLIGHSTGAALSNISLIGFNVTGGTNVGSLVGRFTDNITNVYATGYVHAATTVAGGIGGRQSGNVTNATAIVNVTSTGDSVGGITGLSFAHVFNASARGNITSLSGANAGGITGRTTQSGALHGAVHMSTFTGSVKAASSAGGIIGSSSGMYLPMEIDNSYAVANITTTGANAGGLAGSMASSGVNASYFVGNINGGGNQCGGVTGTTGGNVTFVFVDANISCAGSIGAIVGTGGGTATMTNQSRWNNISVPPMNCYGVVGTFGTSTAQTCLAIQNNSAYFKGDVYPHLVPTSHWMFRTIWDERANDYPVLTWQGLGSNITDSIAPNISMVYPANTTYAIVVNQINFTASSDSDTCIYSTDAGTTNISTSCTTNITGLNANQGSNTWLVSATDLVTNRNMSITTFFVDSIAPNINFSIGTEANNTNFSRNWIYINVSASDVGLSALNISLFNSSRHLVGIINSTTSPLAKNFTGLADGIYYANATAKDSLGNSNNTDTRTYTLDTLNPQIEFGNKTESNDSNLTRNNIVINVTSVDTSLVNITIKLFNSTHNLINETTSTTSPFLLNILGLSNGVYYFNATAYDSLLNTNNTPTYQVNISVSSSTQNATTTSGGGGGSGFSPQQIAADPYLCKKTYEYIGKNTQYDYSMIDGLITEMASENTTIYSWTTVRDYIDRWQFLCSDKISKTLEEPFVCNKLYYLLAEDQDPEFKEIESTRLEIEPTVSMSVSLMEYYVENYNNICPKKLQPIKRPLIIGDIALDLTDFPECSVTFNNTFFDASLPIPAFMSDSTNYYKGSMTCNQIDTWRYFVSIKHTESGYVFTGVKVYLIGTILLLTGLSIVYFKSRREQNTN